MTKVVIQLISFLVFFRHAHAPLLPSEVFEQPCIVGPKKMEFHIPADVPAADGKLDLNKK